jgi:phospholipid/cholesterol/gamma-HCH transport system substrate-binding protein
MRVGLFVVAGLALTMMAVFLIGSTRALWESKVDYVAAFDNVGGLKPGAPVRMGGIDVGTVVAVDHAKKLEDTRIFVDLSVSRNEAARIRLNTVARVVNKGLLGDKMIELSVGSPGAAQLPPDRLITTEEPADIMTTASDLASATRDAIDHLRPLATTLGDPVFGNDIRGAASDIHSLLDAAAHGDGLVHRLFFDADAARRVDQVIASLEQSSTHLERTLADVEEVANQVRSGSGTMHSLIYDDKLAVDTSGTIAELHNSLRAVREQTGLAHSLVYGDAPSQHAIANLAAMSDDLREIVSGVRQGKGTLGALLVDPTVYEDLKSAIGNVERNAVLRSLVRYSIRADEKKIGPK